MRATKLVNTAAICPVAHACSRLVLVGFLNDPGADVRSSQHKGRRLARRDLPRLPDRELSFRGSAGLVTRLTGGYASIMSNSEPAGSTVPEALRPLVEQLAALPPDQRALVSHAAEEAANDAKAHQRTISWTSLKAARGAVNLGGNAVEDCNALYDEC